MIVSRLTLSSYAAVILLRATEIGENPSRTLASRPR
jgi:hypothetical protein